MEVSRNDRFAEMLSESFREFEIYSKETIENDDSWHGFYDVEKAAEKCKFEISKILANYTTSILEDKDMTLAALKKQNI